jgi:desulfoferrodoxin (superoxide reductase-like protein)
MPEISRFLGIGIAMYYNDHTPPHIHARYGGHEVRVHIETGEILSGSLPQRARRHVIEWVDLHRSELMEDWNLAEQRKPLRKIEPLE